MRTSSPAALLSLVAELRRRSSVLLVLCLSFAPLVVLAGCGKEVAAAAKAGPPGPVEVGVVTVQPTAVTLTRELPGRTAAYRMSEVRARVNGIVQKRLFVEGSLIKEGAPLFDIDSAPYQATLSGSKASVARAQATAADARLQAQRVADLVASDTASKEELERVNAARATAEADLAAARAAVTSAKINVQYTRVTAPLSGRIGRALVTEGAFVQQSAATLMATIQQIDPIYVDVTQSTADVLKLRRALAEDKLKPADALTKVTLVLEDGRVYPELGTLQFSDVTVDEGTGSISLRAVFPNPRQELLPGMFVRARIDEGINPEAMMIPQRAVTRDQKGQATAMVVNAEHKVERRTLVADRVVGDQWLISQGLAPGEQVVVEGLQKIRPGAEVTTVPASEKPKTDAPADAKAPETKAADAKAPTSPAGTPASPAAK